MGPKDFGTKKFGSDKPGIKPTRPAEWNMADTSFVSSTA
jgi:hypothetical protein